MAKLPKPPRISVNKLCEFMTAKGARQRQILKDQKYPTDYKGMYYKEASEAIASALASSLEDLSPIEKQVKLLAQQTPTKIGAQRRVAANIDALETFMGMLDDIDLEGIDTQLGEQSPAKLTVHGVEISVRPEVLLTKKGKSGAQIVGALKLHFPRTFCLNEDSAGTVSAILQEWSKIHLADAGACFGPLCPVIDVGSRKVYPGIKATKARMNDVEASCQNIAALWPSI